MEETKKSRKVRETREITMGEKLKAQQIHETFKASKMWEQIVSINPNTNKADRQTTLFLLNLAIGNYLEENPAIKPTRGRYGAASTDVIVDNREIWSVACEIFQGMKTKQVRTALDGTTHGVSVNGESLIRLILEKRGVGLEAEEYDAQKSAVRKALHIRTKTDEGAFKDSGDPRSPILFFSSKGAGEKYAFLKPAWKELMSAAPIEEDESFNPEDFEDEPASEKPSAPKEETNKKKNKK